MHAVPTAVEQVGSTIRKSKTSSPTNAFNGYRYMYTGIYVIVDRINTVKIKAYDVGKGMYWFLP